FLGLNFYGSMLSSFTDVKMTGRLGDPTGVKKYSEIDRSSIGQWQRVFSSKFRCAVLHRYVSSLADVDLTEHGYNRDELLDEIKALSKTQTLSLLQTVGDVCHLLQSRAAMRLKANLVFGRTT